jgi:hypothetical protein
MNKLRILLVGGTFTAGEIIQDDGCEVSCIAIDAIAKDLSILQNYDILVCGKNEELLSDLKLIQHKFLIQPEKLNSKELTLQLAELSKTILTKKRSAEEPIEEPHFQKHRIPRKIVATRQRRK